MMDFLVQLTYLKLCYGTLEGIKYLQYDNRLLITNAAIVLLDFRSTPNTQP